MSAGKLPILRDIAQHKKTWQELWYTMAEGDIVKMNEIKRMDTLTEFWSFFDFWRAKQTKRLEEYRRNQRNLHNEQRK